MHTSVDGEVPRFVLRSVKNRRRWMEEHEGCLEDLKPRAESASPASSSSEEVEFGLVVLAHTTCGRT